MTLNGQSAAAKLDCNKQRRRQAELVLWLGHQQTQTSRNSTELSTTFAPGTDLERLHCRLPIPAFLRLG